MLRLERAVCPLNRPVLYWGLVYDICYSHEERVGICIASCMHCMHCRQNPGLGLTISKRLLRTTHCVNCAVDIAANLGTGIGAARAYSHLSLCRGIVLLRVIPKSKAPDGKLNRDQQQTCNSTSECVSRLVTSDTPFHYTTPSTCAGESREKRNV